MNDIKTEPNHPKQIKNRNRNRMHLNWSELLNMMIQHVKIRKCYCKQNLCFRLVWTSRMIFRLSWSEKLKLTTTITATKRKYHEEIRRIHGVLAIFVFECSKSKKWSEFRVYCDYKTVHASDKNLIFSTRAREKKLQIHKSA